MPQVWLSVPIFGSWFWPDQTLRPGTYKIVSNAQISSDIGNGIVLPKGLVKTGQLNTDESLSIRSFTFESPAADDPDMFPQDFTLTISVTPEGSEKVVYQITPSLDHLPEGIDLSEAVLPEVIPPPGPLLIMGIPGGIAQLDENGLVPLDQLPPFTIDAITHNQIIALATWNVVHDLGRFPIISVFVDGKEVLADIEATNTDVSITFASPTTGVAILV